MKRLGQWLYAPVFFFGFIGLATWLVGIRHLPAWCLVPLAAVAVGVSFLVESWLAYDPDWNRSHGDAARDTVHGFVNEALSILGVWAVPAVAARMPFADHWPHQWPWILQLLLAIIVADFGITSLHRLSHHVRFLWRLHAVHHSVQRMYGFNGLMKHPLHGAIEALAGVAPLLLIGMPVDIAAVLAFAISIQLLLQHSNVDMVPGPLRHVFAWAPLHRFHHMKYGKSGDVNFGLFFTVWDRLWGTAFDSPSHVMRSQDLGIGSRPHYPQGYVRQLLEPLGPETQVVPSPPPPPGLLASPGARRP